MPSQKELLFELMAKNIDKLLVTTLPVSHWNGQEFSYPTPDLEQMQIQLAHPLDKDPITPWNGHNQAFVVPGDIIEQLADLMCQLSDLEESQSE
jgi:hypothetical protein